MRTAPAAGSLAGRDVLIFPGLVTSQRSKPGFGRRKRWQTKRNGRFLAIILRTAVAAVVCPCLVSKAAPLTSRPTEGVCNVPLVFHIESGSYDGIALDGLNVALAIQTPGPMADGNWSVAAYIDERADDKQTEALGAIFTGAAGGPMAVFAPLITKNLRGEKGPNHIPYRRQETFCGNSWHPALVR